MENEKQLDPEILAEKKQQEREANMARFSKQKQTIDYQHADFEQKFGNDHYSVHYNKQPLSLGFRTDFYDELKPSVEIIDEDIRYDRDVKVEISQERHVYLDIYRPLNQLNNLPVIVAYTPYGKRHWHGSSITPGLHQALGVPRGTISKMAAFEGPDPSFWCRQGYCVINVDAPGVGHSTGTNSFMTSQGGRDGAEIIDWIGSQNFSNGNVGLAGNSGLAMVQWMIAAAKPKHLVCIAPWEGTNDLYRESLCVGGIPGPAFGDMIFHDFRGPGWQEDPGYMLKEFPLMNSYWNDKRLAVENIRIPVYATAGYSHFHLHGAITGFERLKTRKKWLRLHRDFEWPDFNRSENQIDLLKFFDRYLRNIHNGWEMTPRIRLEVMDAYEYDYQTNRPEDDFPLARTKYTKYFLNAADRSLNSKAITETKTVKYDSQKEDISFNYTFVNDTELTGHFKLHLWISSETDDADVFVLVQKTTATGTLIPTTVFGVADPGAHGQLRASLRELDQQKSTDAIPFYTFSKRQPLKAGEPTLLEIEIWPTSRIWHAGESLQVNIAGRPIRDKSWFLPTEVESINQGMHTIYTGGDYDSCLLAPVIPPKYTSGKFVVR
ncbi:CocE/NonD family hydrolase [Liquorilactobacillus satsumensis]|uniref:CocE/NonD family hydrolase n=1 Tax=Liquorilactobacillus satsumensis TaxID=259059 RepID=UPI0039E9E425